MPSIDAARIFLGAAAAIAAAGPAAAMEHRVQGDHVLGTSFEMAISGLSDAQAEFAFAAARSEIDRLDAVLSAWRTDSELSKLNGAASLAVSSDLFAVLSLCEGWMDRTDGAYSARLGLLEHAWRTADAIPDTAALCAMAREAAVAPVTLNAASRTVTRPQAVRFAPDGLAKGYVIDVALDAARRAAPCASGMLINIGGDLRCFGVDGSGQPWKAAIADPKDLSDNALPAAVVALSDRALAVSGPGARDREIGGQTVSHLIDPASGQPARRSQVAVVADKAADADALATALAIMPPVEALALAERLPRVEAMIVAQGATTATSGWAALQAPATLCQAPLPAGFVAEVSYELPKIDVGNYKKPFVIVWVTDAQKAVVKTLLIMGDRKDWQESNNVWWRRYGRKTPEILSKASPTKAPGRYAVVWDGTDETGKRAAQGTYTIHVEAAREHGGHAYQAVDVTLGAAGVTAAMPGKDELGAARVRYFKR